MQAVQSFVRQSMAYIPQTPDKESRIELIKTLQTITEGKVSHATSEGFRESFGLCGKTFAAAHPSHQLAYQSGSFPVHPYEVRTTS